MHRWCKAASRGGLKLYYRNAQLRAWRLRTFGATPSRAEVRRILALASGRKGRRHDPIRSRSHPQVGQHALVFAPLRLDGHPQIDEHVRPEEALEVFARRRADALDHLAAAADHDRLLRLALDEDRAIELEQRTGRPWLFEAVDEDRA